MYCVHGRMSIAQGRLGHHRIENVFFHLFELKLVILVWSLTNLVIILSALKCWYFFSCPKLEKRLSWPCLVNSRNTNGKADSCEWAHFLTKFPILCVSRITQKNETWEDKGAFSLHWGSGPPRTGRSRRTSYPQKWSKTASLGPPWTLSWTPDRFSPRDKMSTTFDSSINQMAFHGVPSNVHSFPASF